MSDLMLHGVLNMPVESWSDSELDKIQRRDRYTQASELILELERKNTALTEELQSWVAQHGCECQHPACNRCQDTMEAKQVINANQK